MRIVILSLNDKDLHLEKEAELITYCYRKHCYLIHQLSISSLFEVL